jgi:hypothetical protein
MERMIEEAACLVRADSSSVRRREGQTSEDRSQRREEER